MADLADYAAAFSLSLDPAQLAQFRRYSELLREWNQRINLTAIDAPAEIEIRHFLDSLTVATATGDLSDRRLIDVGTGAGFPGLALKILYPAMALTLVDSVAKKTRFLEAVAAELGLSDVTILAERAETVGRQPAHREQYDWAVARAVAALPVLVDYLLPSAARAERPGPEGRERPARSLEARTATRVAGRWRADPTPSQATRRDETHYLVVIPKVATTPAAYPRSPGRPAKKPLGR